MSVHLNFEEYNRQIFFLLAKSYKREREREKSNNVKIFDNNDSYVSTLAPDDCMVDAHTHLSIETCRAISIKKKSLLLSLFSLGHF
jgi:hypothetical protein